MQMLLHSIWQLMVQQGNFELIKGDSYENIARIITRSDVDNNNNTQAD